MSTALPNQPVKRDKILITGTGRAGTTFLIRLFTLLGMDTGYKAETMENYVWKAANAGMERPISHNVMFVKNPVLIKNLDIHQRVFNLFVVIPMRDLKASATSRVRLGKNPGGLWEATTVDNQEEFYEKILEKARHDIEIYKIPHVYLEFDQMISSADYLFEAFQPMFQKYGLVVDREKFAEAWTKAGELSRPRPENQQDWSARKNQEKVRAF